MASAGKKNLSKSRPGGYLIAVIGDADTVAGFLMAGVGERDGKKDVNYFEVDLSTFVIGRSRRPPVCVGRRAEWVGGGCRQHCGHGRGGIFCAGGCECSTAGRQG